MSDIEFPLSTLAGLMLFLRERIPWEGWPRTVADVLAIVGAGHSQAHQQRLRAFEVVPLMIAKPGRPASQPSDESTRVAVLDTLYDYLLDNPGAVSGEGKRRLYTDDFRRLVVGLRDPGQPGEGMSVAELAAVSRVPQGTLKDWLHPQQVASRTPAADCEVPPGNDVGAEAVPAVDAPLAPAPGPGDNMESKPATAADIEQTAAPCTSSAADESVEDKSKTPASTDAAQSPLSATVRGTHQELIVRLWKSWKGPFQAFCRMLRKEERLRYGDTFIGTVLQSLGLRNPHPRTPVEAPWSSNTFRTLFPGAQWQGDGTEITIRWGDKLFAFNVEAVLDVASTGMMGIDVSKSENEKALHHAYEEGKITSGGAPPLAITLDNKPCNHSPDAQAALEDTTVLRATPGRGQAKAALEGGFGLFQQDLPPLVVTGTTPEEMAACVLRLIAVAYWRGRNGRPRKRLLGRTPAEAYANAKPTPEEIEEARKWFRELQRRQERARLTREARRDPVRIQLLMQGLTELGIPDPDQRLTISLAYYAREAIARGLATFRTKQELGTLPPDADPGRYLGGIIRNLHTRLELERISDHLMEQRIRLRDFTLAPLERAARQLRTEVQLQALPQAFVDRALAATCAVDFRFWTQAAAEALSALPAGQGAALYQPLCRRIAGSFKTDRERREDLIDRLAEVLAAVA